MKELRPKKNQAEMPFSMSDSMTFKFIRTSGRLLNIFTTGPKPPLINLIGRGKKSKTQSGNDLKNKKKKKNCSSS